MNEMLLISSLAAVKKTVLLFHFDEQVNSAFLNEVVREDGLLNTMSPTVAGSFGVTSYDSSFGKSTSRLSTANNSRLELDKGGVKLLPVDGVDFTLEFRVRVLSKHATLTPTLVNIDGLWISHNVNNNNIQVATNQGYTVDTIGVPVANAFNSICVMRKNGVIYFFLNGALTKTRNRSAGFGENTGLALDNNPSYGRYTFDELRLSNVARYDVTGYAPAVAPFELD